MTELELLTALNHLQVETGSLACLGCGYESNCGVHGCAILREFVQAVKEDRVIVLPCKVGDTVIDQTFAENPTLMKNIRLEIAYESRCGIVFHMGYGIFADLVEHGRIKPVSGGSVGEG